MTAALRHFNDEERVEVRTWLLTIGRYPRD